MIVVLQIAESLEYSGKADDHVKMCKSGDLPVIRNRKRFRITSNWSLLPGVITEMVMAVFVLDINSS